MRLLRRLRIVVAMIVSDFRVIPEKDPACRNKWEAAFCYPGFYALMAYRINHELWRYRYAKLLARILSTIARLFTGVDIHPGAWIGYRCFIDHAMCVVIGETAEVGHDCHILHGVTLGGTGHHTGKRHPTVGNNVFLGAHASLLGPIVVGNWVKVGAGTTVLVDIPDHATVVGGHVQRIKQYTVLSST